MRPFIAALLCLLLSAVLSSASAQDMRSETVRFPRGMSSASIKGTIAGRESVRYILDIRSGQRIGVQLDTSNRFNFFNVTEPGADTALFVGSSSGQNANFVARTSGKHVIHVYLMRNAARRNERAKYTLTISAEADRRTGAPRPDYADGLAGGPDFWRVTGVPGGDMLSLRTAPSAGDRIVETARNGDMLRNLGCDMTGGTRWCLVETRRGMKGWAAGRYLREGAAPR